MSAALPLLMDRGDFPSLVACAIQNEPEHVMLWHLLEPDAAAPMRQAAVRAHAEAWGIKRLVVGRALEPGVPDMALPADLFQCSMLLQAVTAARQLGCRRIIWSEQVGPDGDLVAEAVERANMVVAAAEAGQSTARVTIDAPLVDLDDQQVIELADDTGAPLQAAWPCYATGAQPCGICGGCRRWMAAFEARHLAWPWGEGAGRQAS